MMYVYIVNDVYWCHDIMDIFPQGDSLSLCLCCLHAPRRVHSKPLVWPGLRHEGFGGSWWSFWAEINRKKSWLVVHNVGYNTLERSDGPMAAQFRRALVKSVVMSFALTRAESELVSSFKDTLWSLHPRQMDGSHRVPFDPYGNVPEVSAFLVATWYDRCTLAGCKRQVGWSRSKLWPMQSTVTTKVKDVKYVLVECPKQVQCHELLGPGWRGQRWGPSGGTTCLPVFLCAKTTNFRTGFRIIWQPFFSTIQPCWYMCLQ